MCFVHLSVYTHTDIEGCYAQAVKPGEPIRSTPATWPIIKLFFSGGHTAVMVFFTISGYVLTKKLISLLHEGRRDDFIESVNSAMVRRPLRLFYPVVLSTFAFAMSWHIFRPHDPLARGQTEHLPRAVELAARDHQVLLLLPQWLPLHLVQHSHLDHPRGAQRLDDGLRLALRPA